MLKVDLIDKIGNMFKFYLISIKIAQCISKVEGKTGVKIPNSVNISASDWATELRKINPHGQCLWNGITFQSSIYHGLSFKTMLRKNKRYSIITQIKRWFFLFDFHKLGLSGSRIISANSKYVQILSDSHTDFIKLIHNW